MKNRYILKKGKFGFYYYDSYVNVDCNLEMILNRLNGMSNTIDKLRVNKSVLTTEVFNLKEKLRVFKIKENIWSKSNDK